MPFKTGISGNAKGRPRGRGNKITGQLRDEITKFLESEFATVQTDFKNLLPRDRLKFYSDLLPYVIPKLQSTSLEIDFDKLTDEQLDVLIEKITHGQLKE